MTETDLQKELFATIKNILPPHISLVDSIADLLNISYDSVYRRIRGEKPVSLNELKILCEHFHLSLDHVLNFKNENVVFTAPEINDTDPDFGVYLKKVLGQMKYFNSFENRDMLYQCKDAPVFYFYLYPEIGAFKTFCWIKTIFNHPDYEDKVFSVEEFPFKDINELGRQILKEYSMLPSTELWNFESFNSTINQIQYYKDAGLFKSREDLLAVVDSFNRLLDHLQEQARFGVKFLKSVGDANYKAPFKFFINEVLLGNNTFVVTLNEECLSIITYNALSYLMTKDERFGKKLSRGFHTLVSRATLISGSGEKERNRFFRIQREKILELKK